MAMITAILVCTVVLFLGVTSVGLSDHSFSALRIDRKRVATFHAAEAGIDHALQVLQTTQQASLPCASPLTAALGVGPGSADYSVTFTYFDAAGTALACPLTTTPRSVLLESVGNSTDPVGSSRTVTVAANLSIPITVAAFDKVMFSESGLAINTNLKIMGHAGNDATVYTNGNYSCVNTPLLQGSIYAQGTATIGNRCEVNVDVWAAGAATTNNFAVVGRDLISGNANVTLNGNSTVKRNARAATTVTVSTNATVGGLSIPNSPIGNPPSSTFPQVPYVQSDWVNAGYTVRSYTNCVLADTELRTLAPTWTTPTLVRITGCRLDVGNLSAVTLAADLAIVSDLGMSFAQNTEFTSVVPPAPAVISPKELHLIVPYMASPCTADIRMSQQFSVHPSISVLAYTPCTLEIQNRGVLHGQFYGGTIELKNDPTLRYTPVSGIPGYSPSVTTQLVRQVAVLYKREV